MNVKVAILLCLIQYIFSYTITGNQLYGPNGNAILIRGVDRPSLEWSATGESMSLADFQLMQSWGFNLVRLSLNQDFWLSGSSTYASGYVAKVAQVVAWIKQCNMGVILDLHWSDKGSLSNSGAQQNMADANSITFWTQVAGAYKNDPWVMFELYNEPHDVSWSVWQNGGNAGDFTAVGMQQMYNAVRNTGANNVVIIGGLDWAYDLSGVSNGYAITGTNIMYNTHVYDYPGKQAANWDSGFGNLAATHPIMMTEFGQYCATNDYVQTLLDYADSKKIHWTAWGWYPGGCSFPAIINDWNGTPSSPVGVLIQQRVNPNYVPPVTPAPSPATPAPAATGNLAIYTDSLQNGWLDYSWSNPHSLTNSNPVQSGSASISMDMSGYAGIYFHSATGYTISQYQSLQFYVNGATSSLVVKLYDSAAQIGNQVTVPSSSSGSWSAQNIALTSFGLASSTKFYGVVIMNSASSSGTIYLDTVSLIAPAATPAPSTPAPATPSPATSTPKPATPAPATPAPATPAPTPKPSTPAPATPAPATPAPATPAPATPAPATPAPATPAPTPKPSTPAPATPTPSTPAPSTPAPSTPTPSTPAPSTPKPSTPAPSTPTPSTQAPTTPSPSTDAPSTPRPSTPSPTTDSPSTSAPATPKPSTPAPATNGGSPSTSTPSAPTTSKPNNSTATPAPPAPTEAPKSVVIGFTVTAESADSIDTDGIHNATVFALDTTQSNVDVEVQNANGDRVRSEKFEVLIDIHDLSLTNVGATGNGKTVLAILYGSDDLQKSIQANNVTISTPLGVVSDSSNGTTSLVVDQILTGEAGSLTASLLVAVLALFAILL